MKIVSDKFLPGVIGSFIGVSSNLLMQVASVPLLLYVGGPDLLGKWIFLLSVLSIIAILDFGILEAVSAGMAHSALSISRDSAQTLLDAGTAIITLMLGIGLVISTIYVGFSDSPLLYKLSLCFACLAVVFSMSLRLSIACFKSQNEFGYGYLIVNLIIFTSTIAILFTIWKGHSIEAVCICSGTIQIIGTLYMLKITGSRTGWRTNLWQFNAIYSLKSLHHAVIGNIAMPGATMVLNSGFILFITSALGPTAAAAFNTARTLFRAPNQLQMLVTASMSTEIWQFEIARKHKEAKKSLMLGLTSTFIFFASGLLIYYFGDEIYAHWTKGKLQFDRHLSLLLILDTGAMMLSFFSFSVLQTRQRGMICGVTALCVTSLALAALLLQKFLGWDLSLYQIALYHLVANATVSAVALVQLKMTTVKP